MENFLRKVTFIEVSVEIWNFLLERDFSKLKASHAKKN